MPLESKKNKKFKIEFKEFNQINKSLEEKI